MQPPEACRDYRSPIACPLPHAAIPHPPPPPSKPVSAHSQRGGKGKKTSLWAAPPMAPTHRLSAPFRCDTIRPKAGFWNSQDNLSVFLGFSPTTSVLAVNLLSLGDSVVNQACGQRNHVGSIDGTSQSGSIALDTEPRHCVVFIPPRGDPRITGPCPAASTVSQIACRRAHSQIVDADATRAWVQRYLA